MARISFKNVNKTYDNGVTVIDGLNLDINDKEFVVLVGPSGCGKSTLIKTIAGIWPHAEGEILEPENYSTLFLSQKPYLPLGTLRDAISYPGERVKDGRIEKYLHVLSLDYLISDLDKEDNWSLMLSLGEQQRIAIIRVLLIKPKILFLDEASSALDERIESVSYDLLRTELKESVILSVGHRSSLIAKHELMLISKNSNGEWILENTKDAVKA